MAELEKKYGTYIMQSSGIMTYEELKSKPNFQILEFENALYRGQIVSGVREGIGIMIYQSGRIYEGNWLSDRRQGMGYERYANGNSYKGMFERGKANGNGMYIWKNG